MESEKEAEYPAARVKVLVLTPLLLKERLGIFILRDPNL
jgi:hypothetical protein